MEREGENVKNKLLIYLILIYNIYIIYKYCFLFELFENEKK